MPEIIWLFVGLVVGIVLYQRFSARRAAMV